ncbi:hypothetical protein CK203_067778 [Vitis vinifera]|uniref:Uncharacterized protein n=1 Tax=Vitis vinifera TaxID=29760 RepID=A0A438BZR8_VITVI|nr:hypothetical protein CK203_067778 [Vitis vinifera]
MDGSKIAKSSESRTELLSRIQIPKRQPRGTALYTGVSRCLECNCDRIHKPNGDRFKILNNEAHQESQSVHVKPSKLRKSLLQKIANVQKMQKDEIDAIDTKRFDSEMSGGRERNAQGSISCSHPRKPREALRPANLLLNNQILSTSPKWVPLSTRAKFASSWRFCSAPDISMSSMVQS